ncbi:hypothetical protein [Lyngbya sp. PCC 8106]|uniref:hypothetical protein n=1 Tax=Lyngbya sp. (strain PCC 8106) TaxID=313612 RepID=UPI0012E9E7EE|nr:hypothetical protein [Lyngbya sp. PCC 8106]
MKLVPQNERQLIVLEYLKSIGEGERRSQIWMCLENLLLASVLSESDIPETDPIFFKSSLMIHASNLHWAVSEFKKLLESHNMGELFFIDG